MNLARRFFSIGATLAVVSTSIMVVSASPAAAADPCAGKSTNHIVKNFTRGFVNVPLRCGTSTWGYRHLAPKHGYNSSMIANTVSRGKQSFGFYYQNLSQCPPMAFKVVFNNGPIGGSGVSPQGIITAYYQPGHIASAASSRAAAAC